MKYYEYSSSFELDYDAVKDYISETDRKNEVFKLCFNDSQIHEFFNATNTNWCFGLGLSAYFIGEDKYFYEFKPDGSVVKSKKCTKKIERQLWNSRLRIASKIRRNKRYSSCVITKYNNTVNFVSKSASGFDKYLFVDSDKNDVIPFRFRKAASDKAPFVIYFHGAGCIGHDNIKPLIEYKNFMKGNVLPDCNILIPQAFYGANFLNSNITGYVSSCIQLANLLIDKFSVEKNRVYCFGTSFGGCCVWYAVSMFPEMFAAAVPVMGIMLQYKDFLPVLKEHCKIPIWIAHSSDDNNVSIVTDDYIYSQLKEINPNLRYTRWDKYGHKMAKHFYKKEPFIDWMFDKSL